MKTKTRKKYAGKWTKKELARRVRLARTIIILIAITVSGSYIATAKNSFTIQGGSDKVVQAGLSATQDEVGVVDNSTPIAPVELQGSAVILTLDDSTSLGIKEVSSYSELDSCHYPAKGGCLTSSGRIAKLGMVATNLHPFGTKLRIGNEIYIVEDRISKRFNHRYDIWMGTGEKAYKQALNFGIQYLEVEIIN